MNFEPIINSAVKLSFTICMMAIAAAAVVFMQPTVAKEPQPRSFAVRGYIATDGCLVLQDGNTPIWALCNDNTHAATEN